MGGWRRYWPVVVPVAWAAAVLAVMRPGMLGPREWCSPGSYLVYDPTDFGAFALRGANAAAGRLPGRIDAPMWVTPQELAARLDGPPVPFSERYYLEYPTAALVVFRLGFPAAVEFPPAVADTHHVAVSQFVPRTDAERWVWAAFHSAAVVYVLVSAAGLVGLILVLIRGYESGAPPGAVWLAVLPGAVYFSLNRFDVLPALATALGFACLGRNRPAWSGGWFAIGALLKVYPVLFAPVILRYLGPKMGTAWLAGFAGVVLAGVGVSVAAVGWEGTVGPIRVQLGRELEPGWSHYGRLLPVELANHSPLRLAILAGAVLAAAVTRPADLSAVLRRCGVVLVVFVLLAVFWSPQWVVWFLPIVVPLAGRSRTIAALAAAIDLLAYLTFALLCWVLSDYLDPAVADRIGVATIYLRTVLWLALAVVLAWPIRAVPPNPR